MEQVRARRLGAKGWVCALGCSSALFMLDAQASAEPAVIDLAETADLPGVVVFPTRASGPRPITVVLHGMCGEPIRTCSHFVDEVTAASNLVCPRARQACAGGGASWPAAGFAETVESAIERAKSVLPEPPDEGHGRTLIGYSLGAYRALEIAQSGAGKYPRVMLIGAKVFPNQKLLAEHGVLRLLLSAGAWDMMHDPMQHEAARVLRAGFPARFLDLGPVGHAFTASFAAHLSEGLAWLGGAEPAQ